VITRPVLRYHGGKWKIAPWIISNFPPHRIYVEPFGGAASILMRKPRSYAEVYNDLWGIVVNVFRVLRDPLQAQELERLLRLTPFSREEFNECGDEELSKIEDPIERARRTIFRSFAGFGSAATNAAYATGFRANSNRSGTTPAHDWQHYPDQVRFFVERLHGVVIENRPAEEIFNQHDGLETLHYIDPPYPHITRNMQRGNSAYAHEMTDNEHSELAIALHKLRGMVIVSGYACRLYDELFKGWQRIDHATHADGAKDRIECLWLSPNIQNYSLFSCTEEGEAVTTSISD
jgi:DNA adenine methylase